MNTFLQSAGTTRRSTVFTRIGVAWTLLLLLVTGARASEKGMLSPDGGDDVVRTVAADGGASGTWPAAGGLGFSTEAATVVITLRAMFPEPAIPTYVELTDATGAVVLTDTLDGRHDVTSVAVIAGTYGLQVSSSGQGDAAWPGDTRGEVVESHVSVDSFR